MPYKLKKTSEKFTEVDGKFAGRTYQHNEIYQEIPPHAAAKFEEIKEEQSNSKNPTNATNSSPLTGEGKGEGEVTKKKKMEDINNG